MFPGVSHHFNAAAFRDSVSGGVLQQRGWSAMANVKLFFSGMIGRGRGMLSRCAVSLITSKAKMTATLFAVVLLLLWCTQSAAQEVIKYPSVDPGGNAVEVVAILRVPMKPLSAGQKFAAVILLHSKGGWEIPVTEQYARALSDAGFLVVEPRLFATQASAPAVGITLLPMVYDALRYVSGRDDVDGKRIGVAGFSFGGALALHSAATWAQAAHANRSDFKFAAHAPFYPTCWAFSAFAQGKRKTPGLPVDAFTKWTGAPVKIFAGGRDDYDGKDPNACAEFVSHIPAAYQSSFSVRVYADATHGWDQQSVSFYESSACKGKGCTNINDANPKITEQSIKDLVEFFGKALALAHP